MGTFLILSMLSGILETGMVLKTYAAGPPIWVALLMAAMYQFGNLLFIPEKNSRNKTVKTGICSLILYMASACFESVAAGNAQWIPLVFGIQALWIIATSFCIQAVREVHKRECPTWKKRLFRIFGFAGSWLMAVFPQLMMLICTLIPLIAAVIGKDSDFEKEASKAQDGKKLSSVMIFHQMHYFVYTYILLITAARLTSHIACAVMMYGLTWGVYLLPGLLMENQKEIDKKKIFFVCHIFLAVMMGLLAVAFFTENLVLGIGAWMLTGLGGGSVFCIKELPLENGKYSMELSENIGHFLGTALSVLIALVVPDSQTGLLAASVSCLCVCSALAAAGRQIWKKEGFVPHT